MCIMHAEKLQDKKKCLPTKFGWYGHFVHTKLEFTPNKGKLIGISHYPV